MPAGFVTPQELYVHDWNESGCIDLYDLNEMYDHNSSRLFIPRRFLFWYRFRLMLPAVLLTFFSFGMETVILIPWYAGFFFKYYKFTVWCKNLNFSAAKLWAVMVVELIVMLILWSFPRPYIINFFRWQLREIVFRIIT